ncbi:methyl-accepting chemotaxis protein [Aliarcobacter butzleri]|uniref:Methyl-accepting chemotaxis protein n=1 Tax=Aliarcobacter butzleri TaxID=28197 RepID=A0AAW7PUI0_9BACT|nr:methyl-accepting chemotaxis protein [Aliarcobacter butzleri]MDN5064679.1 methyl-accepting chemotaxis protein [Aliarcobacter butzleri]MDN5066860.1 methyl-accepting chemotaxis protein [Aliarcobacter butzleri]
MNNLKLRNKILLILALPILAIFMLSSVLIFEKIEKKSNMNKTSSYIDFTVKISKVLTAFQKERELSILYLNSYGKIKKDELEKEIINSNQESKELNQFIESFDLIKKDNNLLEKIDKLKKSFIKLDEIRKNIIDLRVDIKEIENFYNEINANLISFFDDLLIYSNSKELSKSSLIYVSIINVIEKAYNEKILVKSIFEHNFMSNSNYNNFISLIVFQDSYLEVLKKNLSNEQLEDLKKQLEDNSFKDIEKLRSIIFLKIEKENLLAQIKEAFGYGGLIHLYKNYVLTKDENLLNKIQKSHTKILRAIKDYKKLEFSKEEEELLNNIQLAIDTYMAAAYNSERIDETQLDSKTLQAIDTLSKNIYGANSKKWEEASSLKITIFENIKDKMVEDMLLYINTNVKNLDNQIVLFSLFLIFLIILIFAVIILMTSKVSKSIKKFENNLTQFFSYSMREKDEIYLDRLEGKDEFALMTKNMNTQVEKIERIIENDKKVILEITDIMEKVNNGFFEYSIKTKASTKELQTLVEIINKMIDRTRLKIDSLNMLLNSYTQGDYKFKLDEQHTKGMYGDFGILCNSTVLLGQSSSELIAMITNAGVELEKNTKILTNSSNELAVLSSEQANSLKQSSVALEQITANIKNNNENMGQMLKISDELNSSAIEGNKSANQTFVSMDEISKKVNAINEAIIVIDQIAFQTNILSLNAAVEAATAGEAGKGFAVVAQEVRNLASRSAQAASKIKSLVESANFEANEGKNIADNMIKGYESLASKISQTKEIINSVTIFSKEQEIGIIQINDTISKIDFATQKNAKTALNIDNLSNEVSKLSNKLLQITSQSKIDDKYYEMVENIDLIKELSTYKNDHINFKKRYYKTLNNFTNIVIDNSEFCNIGKWMTSCENNNEIFAKDEKWRVLKQNHKNIHQKMQEYITQNANKIENKILRQIASQIEDATMKFFDSLNDILYLDSKNKK